jgi:hypothetical protein
MKENWLIVEVILIVIVSLLLKTLVKILKYQLRRSIGLNLFAVVALFSFEIRVSRTKFNL